jgi:LacI family transcriptional regulator
VINLNKKISSKDVAKEAGVSRTTVSYVLNNTDGVKIRPETRQIVLETAKRLGYFGNSIARSMKTGKVMSIGIVSKWNVTHQRFAEVLNGIKSITSQNNFSITLCSDTMDDNGVPEFLNYYFGKKIDGIILLSAGEQLDLSIVETIVSKNIPSVFVGYDLENFNLNCINIDYYQGAYSATEQLLKKGSNKIIALLHEIKSNQEVTRLKGIEAAINDWNNNSIKLKSIFLTAEDNNSEVIKNILINRDDFTGIIASWRSTAFTTLYYANTLNIKIPSELSVISLDGSEFADYSFPKLSTSDLPLYEIGEKSASALINTINGLKDPVNLTVSCSLNLRESTK